MKRPWRTRSMPVHLSGLAARMPERILYAPNFGAAFQEMRPTAARRGGCIPISQIHRARHLTLPRCWLLGSLLTVP